MLPIGTKTKALPALLRQQITQYQIRIYKLKDDPALGIGTKIEADGVNQAMLKIVQRCELAFTNRSRKAKTLQYFY